MRKRNLFAGFAIALLLTLGIASTNQNALAQQANNFTCDNGPNPIPDGYSGPIDLSQWAQEAPQLCVLGDKHVGGDFSVSGFQSLSVGSITSDNGNIIVEHTLALTTGNLTAGGSIRAFSPVSVSLGKVTSNSGNVLISSGADVSTKAVKANNGYVNMLAQGTIKSPSITATNGDVRIFANGAQTAGVTQKIGSGGIGSITIVSGSGNGIYVSDTAGIDYVGDNILQPNVSTNPGGFVVLDTGTITNQQNGFEGANTGTVTLSGSINVDGSGGSPAGFLNIFAAEIIAKNATLSASSPNAQVGTVNLVTNLITNRSGLTVNVNGNNNSQTIDLSIFPIGSYSLYRPTIVFPFVLPIVYADYTTSTNPLNINGAGALTINANGNNNGIKIFGYPLKISPASTTISNNGGGNLVTIQGTDGGSQLNKLTWGGPVQIRANNSSTDQSSNLIQIVATDISDLTDSVFLDASGGTGTANGSNITISTSSKNFNIGGSGGVIETLNASAGQSGGNAGQITVSNTGGNISVLSGSILNSSVSASNGNGGSVSLTAGTPTVNGKITISGIVKADAGVSGGFGQQVFLKYSDLSTAVGIVVNGAVLNNSGPSSPGSIIFQNQVDSGDLAVRVNASGLISAENSQLRFVQPNESVKVISTGTTPNGSLVGHIVSVGRDITINIPAEGPFSKISIERLEASSGDVTVNAPRTFIEVLSTNSNAAISSQQKVSLNGSGFDIGIDSTTGKDLIQGLSVSVESLNASINLGSDIRADDEIKIKATGSGNIFTRGGTAGSRSPGESTRLVISTEEGRIGENPFIPFSKAFKTEVTDLVASNTSSSADATVNIVNSTSSSGGLRIANTACGGTFQIASNGSVQVGNLSVKDGSIGITAGSGELRVRSAAALIVAEGNISLANSDTTLGTIVIAPGADIRATTTSPDTNFRGNVAIFLGNVLPIFGHNHSNPNVTIFGDAILVDFGNVGITALNDPSEINVSHRIVQFDANMRREAIKLLGNVSITAQGN